jgi:hypothetical protein
MQFVNQFLSIAVAVASANAAFGQTASSTSGPPPAGSGKGSAAPTVLVGDTLSKLGTVLSIDREKRDVILESDDGQRLVVPIGKEVRNFDSLRVGDRISVTLGEAIAVAPAQSTENHLRLETTRTAQPADSERALIREVKRTAMVVKVAKIDKEANTATLHSPNGETFVVSLEGQENPLAMKEGNQLAVIHVETMALTESPRLTGSPLRAQAGSSAADQQSAGGRKTGAPAVVSGDAGSGAGYVASVERLQTAAKQLREAIQAMASSPAGEERTQAIAEARKALSEVQEAMALAALKNAG